MEVEKSVDGNHVYRVLSTGEHNLDLGIDKKRLDLEAQAMRVVQIVVVPLQQ